MKKLISGQPCALPGSISYLNGLSQAFSARQTPSKMRAVAAIVEFVIGSPIVRWDIKIVYTGIVNKNAPALDASKCFKASYQNRYASPEQTNARYKMITHVLIEI